jgi:hypothetical protein
MRPEDRDVVRNWLHAEETGGAEAADRAFASVASALPMRLPSRRFAARVMTRVSASTTPLTVWRTSWEARLAVAASLITLGVVLGTWSFRSMFFATLAIAQSFAWGVGQVATGSVVWIETALAMWETAAHAAAVLSRLLATPGPAMVVGVNVAVAACACAALRRLLASQEE